MKKGVENGYLTAQSRREDSLLVVKLHESAYASRLSQPMLTLKLATEALRVSEKLSDKNHIGNSHRIIGIGYDYLENDSLALKNYIAALSYFMKAGNQNQVARTYNNIGNIYKDVDNKQALRYYQRSLRIAQKTGDRDLLAGLYFNVATIYEESLNFEQALSNFDKSYSIFKERGDTSYMTLYLQNTGFIYYRQGKFAKAERLLNEAVNTALKHRFYKVLSGCYLILARIHIHNEAYDAANNALAEGEKYANILGESVYEFRYLTYQLRRTEGDLQSAIKVLEEIYRSDSLELGRRHSDNIGITTLNYLQRQKIKEKELMIVRQKYQEAQFKWLIASMVSLFLLSVVIGFIIYIRKDRRAKAKELLTQSNIAALEQKALQAMMNPHFVFNVMNTIQHFINESDPRKANQILTGFARMTRKHLEICMNSSITLSEELVYLQLYLSLEQIRFPAMKFEVILDEEIDAEEFVIPSMLIQPFIENSIWHGLMPNDGIGNITVDIDLDEDFLIILIIDDGIGIENAATQRNPSHISRGIALIRERIVLMNKLNERQLTISQQQMGEKGTKVTIKIPV